MTDRPLPTFTCPRCGMRSHNPKDVEQRYCGNCHQFVDADPELQLWFDLRRAADQMAVAQWQAAHPGNELMIPDRADLVIWLLDQLASYRRLDRVDTAIAKQLGDSIAANARLTAELAELKRTLR